MPLLIKVVQMDQRGSKVKADIYHHWQELLFEVQGVVWMGAQLMFKWIFSATISFCRSDYHTRL